jgi:hypothetical protein
MDHAIMEEGNLPEQHVTQSPKESAGQAFTQSARLAPSSPPVQVASSGQRSEHSCTQMAKTVTSVGQPATQAWSEPPGQELGAGDGLGVGVGVGVGAGAVKVPLVTQPPQPSSTGESTELFSQHSLLSWTQVYPTHPASEEHFEQQASALDVMSAVPFKLVPKLFLPTKVSQVPAGLGDGEGDGEGVGLGCGPEHLVGSGPWTTVPEMRRFEMEKVEPSNEPGPPPQ